MRSGALLYFEQVNASGGVHGRRIRLQTLDDGYEPERTTANTRKLIEEEKVLASSAMSARRPAWQPCPVYSEGALRRRVPPVRRPCASRSTATSSMCAPPGFDETEKIVEQLTTTGIKQIAVFYQNDAYGKAGLAGSSGR